MKHIENKQALEEFGETTIVVRDENIVARNPHTGNKRVVSLLGFTVCYQTQKVELTLSVCDLDNQEEPINDLFLKPYMVKITKPLEDVEINAPADIEQLISDSEQINLKTKTNEQKN